MNSFAFYCLVPRSHPLALRRKRGLVYMATIPMGQGKEFKHSNYITDPSKSCDRTLERPIQPQCRFIIASKLSTHFDQSEYMQIVLLLWQNYCNIMYYMTPPTNLGKRPYSQDPFPSHRGWGLGVTLRNCLLKHDNRVHYIWMHTQNSLVLEWRMVISILHTNRVEDPDMFLQDSEQ